MGVGLKEGIIRFFCRWGWAGAVWRFVNMFSEENFLAYFVEQNWIFYVTATSHEL